VEEITPWLPSLTWLLPLFSPLAEIIILLMFDLHILNLLVKFVSLRLDTIKLQMVLKADLHKPKSLSWYQGLHDRPLASLRRP
jgi:hypothetical protein